MKDRLLLLGIVAAFVFMGLEVRYLHAGITETEPVAWVPTVTAGLAIFICLLGLIGDKKMNKILGVILIVLSFTGLVGFYFHHGGSASETPDLTGIERVVTSDLRTDRLNRMMDGGEAADPPPDLAPLSFTGLCLLGAMVLMVQRKEPRVS